MNELRKDLKEVLDLFGKYDGDLIGVNFPNEEVKVSLGEHKDDRENRLINLLQLCNKVNASLVTFNLLEGTGIVELENGTPSSISYDESTKTWN